MRAIPQRLWDASCGGAILYTSRLPLPLSLRNDVSNQHNTAQPALWIDADFRATASFQHWLLHCCAIVHIVGSTLCFPSGSMLKLPSETLPCKLRWPPLQSSAYARRSFWRRDYPSLPFAILLLTSSSIRTFQDKVAVLTRSMNLSTVGGRVWPLTCGLTCTDMITVLKTISNRNKQTSAKADDPVKFLQLGAQPQWCAK